MAGYPLPPFDPNQQLNQDPTQGQAPPQNQGQPSPSQAPPVPQGGDPYEPIKQGLAQRIAQYQQQQNAPANNGGAFKRILGNFFQGAGNAMMHDAGLPTPYEQNQRDIQNLNAISAAQSTAQLHQAMAGMYGTVPVQVIDPENPGQFKTVMVQQKDAASVLKSQIAAGARTGAAQIGANARLGAAQIMTGPPVATTPEMQQMGLPPQLPLRFANQAQGLMTRPLQVVQGEQGPAIINKLNPSAPPTQIPVGNPRAMFAPGNRYVQVVNPENPDDVNYMRAAQAAQSGATAPASVGFQANKAVTRSAVAGPIGQSLNAFNTATEHLKLLSNLGDELRNGPIQPFNAVAQKYAQLTGGDAPVNFDMAKNAVVGEVAKTFKGNATEAEIASINQTINRAQSPAQLKGAINTALTLMNAKKQALQQQVQQGKTGKPAFNAPAPTGGGFAAFVAGRRQ